MPKTDVPAEWLYRIRAEYSEIPDLDLSEQQAYRCGGRIRRCAAQCSTCSSELGS